MDADNQILEILSRLYRDISDRKGMLDSVDDEAQAEMITSWYCLIGAVLGRSILTEIRYTPEALLQAVRNWRSPEAWGRR